jgi:hypothetical protein
LAELKPGWRFALADALPAGWLCVPAARWEKQTLPEDDHEDVNEKGKSNAGNDSNSKSEEQRIKVRGDER